MSKTDQPSDFITYEHTEEKVAAQVTAENIGTLAAFLKAQVDYSRGEPVLVVTRGSGYEDRLNLGDLVTTDGRKVSFPRQWRPAMPRIED